MAEHVIKLSSEAPDVSDSEVSSLCGSELELEMAWGEGPIAPLRTEAAADDGAANKSLIAGVERSGSNGNGSSRARTPQKRGSEFPLARSKRLINIHPIRSAGSNFQKLAEPQNEDLQTEFRKGGSAHENNRSHAPRNRRKDEWNGECNACFCASIVTNDVVNCADAEQMFTRVDRRARTLMLRSFSSFALFIEAVEYVVLHFIQISLSEFIRETRIARRHVVAVSPEKVVNNGHALELQSKNARPLRLDAPRTHTERHMEQNAPLETEVQVTPLPDPVKAEEIAIDTDDVAAASAAEPTEDDNATAKAAEETGTRSADGADDGESEAETTVQKDAVEAQNDAAEDDSNEVEHPSTPDEEEVTEAAEDNVAPVAEVAAVERSSDVIAEAEEKQEEPTPADGEGDAVEDASTPDAVSDNETAEENAAAQEEETPVEEAVVKEDPATTDDTEEKLEAPLTIVKPDMVVAAEGEKDGDSTPIESNKLEAPVLSIDADAPANPATEDQTPASGIVPNSLIADGAVATPEGALLYPQELELASPAAMPDLLVAATDADTESSSDPEPAKPTPVDANLEAVLEKIRNKLTCESVEVLESGEILALPKGWSTRQSKTNDGKTYYVSPYGHTQWLRPPMKTGVIYKWVHEIEVTFGPGRLGLNLKQIAGIPGTEFTDLQVHIAEIYKLPNGMASPAEIYNWSVKPEKRLAVNMRVTMMNGISLTGYTYSEVLELLARMVRPVRIKFADTSKGIVGRVEEEIPHEETEEVKEARAARVMQNSLRSEYFQILVSYELHKQVWTATKRHMRLKMIEMEKKNEVMESQVEAELQHQESLEKERENLIQEAGSLKEMIEQLDKQTAGEIESPEVLRTAELALRTAELEKEVTEIIAENDELQASRVKIEETLDDLQKELDAYGDLDVDPTGQHEIKFFSPAFLGSMVHRGSIDTRAEDARERLLEKIKAQHGHLEEEIKLEEERAKFVESEINQFQQQMDVAAEAVKREDAFISGERPPQMIFLENKIALLRKNLRETVAGIANAGKCGDQQQADNLSLRRAHLKDDLKAALDEMRRMENELNVFFDVDEGKQVKLLRSDSSIDTVNIDEAPHERASESSRLQNKLTKLQMQLHDTVVQLAKAAGEKDEARKSELGKRRLQLKDEMKVVQDQFQLLTNGTLNVAVKNKESSYLRPSVVGPPTMQDVPRRSTGGSRASLGGIRASISGSMASMAASRASHGGRPSESVQRGSERHDPNVSRRSSSSASLTQSNDSNQMPRDGTLPPDGYLRYYKREGDREPRGAIPLKHKSLEILHGKGVGKPNEFVICSSTHQTRMVAKTRDDMLKWVMMLELAHAYFMQHGRGSIDDGNAPGSVSSSVGSNADHLANATSPGSADPELVQSLSLMIVGKSGIVLFWEDIELPYESVPLSVQIPLGSNEQVSTHPNAAMLATQEGAQDEEIHDDATGLLCWSNQGNVWEVAVEDRRIRVRAFEKQSAGFLSGITKSVSQFFFSSTASRSGADGGELDVNQPITYLRVLSSSMGDTVSMRSSGGEVVETADMLVLFQDGMLERRTFSTGDVVDCSCVSQWHFDSSRVAISYFSDNFPEAHLAKVYIVSMPYVQETCFSLLVAFVCSSSRAGTNATVKYALFQFSLGVVDEDAPPELEWACVLDFEPAFDEQIAHRFFEVESFSITRGALYLVWTQMQPIQFSTILLPQTGQTSVRSGVFPLQGAQGRLALAFGARVDQSSFDNNAVKGSVSFLLMEEDVKSLSGSVCVATASDMQKLERLAPPVSSEAAVERTRRRREEASYYTSESSHFLGENLSVEDYVRLILTHFHEYPNSASALRVSSRDVASVAEAAVSVDFQILDSKSSSGLRWEKEVNNEAPPQTEKSEADISSVTPKLVRYQLEEKRNRHVAFVEFLQRRCASVWEFIEHSDELKRHLIENEEKLQAAIALSKFQASILSSSAEDEASSDVEKIQRRLTGKFLLHAIEKTVEKRGYQKEQLRLAGYNSFDVFYCEVSKIADLFHLLGDEVQILATSIGESDPTYLYALLEGGCAMLSMLCTPVQSSAASFAPTGSWAFTCEVREVLANQISRLSVLVGYSRDSSDKQIRWQYDEVFESADQIRRLGTVLLDDYARFIPLVSSEEAEELRKEETFTKRVTLNPLVYIATQTPSHDSDSAVDFDQDGAVTRKRADLFSQCVELCEKYSYFEGMVFLVFVEDSENLSKLDCVLGKLPKSIASKRLESYCKKHEGFDNFIFRWYNGEVQNPWAQGTQEASATMMAYLLAHSQIFAPSLHKFMKSREHLRKYRWLTAVSIERYDQVATLALREAKGEQRSLPKRKTMASIAKIAAFASLSLSHPERVEEINHEVPGPRKLQELLLQLPLKEPINSQPLSPEELVHACLSSALSAEKGDPMRTNIFLMALEALETLATDPLTKEYEEMRAGVWRSCIVDDGELWDNLAAESAAGVNEEKLESLMRQTLLYKVMKEYASRPEHRRPEPAAIDQDAASGTIARVRDFGSVDNTEFLQDMTDLTQPTGNSGDHQIHMVAAAMLPPSEVSDKKQETPNYSVDQGD
ncbi:WD40/YVTN repeat-like-containing domain [Phytophthora cactorum]|nr:WD40/YVTN repeat-like-containing domain [Phytophthora cactorum]